MLQRVFAAQPQLCTFFSRHQYAVNSVAFSPDGKTLASASRDVTDPVGRGRRFVDAQGLSHRQPEFNAQRVGAVRGRRCSVLGALSRVAGVRRMMLENGYHHRLCR